ncbi:ubiquitin carboxyl-terminal hydrolase [Boletus coccyginus]|nr:ubiquitin carboxyl-terminal hydrolase [Boletus coccyginus]
MSDEDSSGWELTESDPGVFTELLKTLSVPYIVDDLYSLDPEALSALQPLHALIFLFKWLPSTASEPSSTAGEYDTDFPGFFAHQTVNNSCATLAVINALGNIPSLPSGTKLADLMSFTSGMDPQTCGMVVTSADWLREAHNALSPPSSISLDGLGLPKKTEDAYHFVVYVPVMGSVYELDGLKPYPVRHGGYDESGEGWLRKVREVIEHRIATYPTGALEFSLLALRDDPLPALKTQLEHLEQTRNLSEASQVLVKISNENSKRDRWAFENSIRRHNHIGLVHALLVGLAEAGQLSSATDNARKVMRERIARRREMGLGDMDED